MTSTTVKQIIKREFGSQFSIIPDRLLDIVAPCDLVEKRQELRHIERIEKQINQELHSNKYLYR